METHPLIAPGSLVKVSPDAEVNSMLSPIMTLLQLAGASRSAVPSGAPTLRAVLLLWAPCAGPGAEYTPNVLPQTAGRAQETH